MLNEDEVRRYQRQIKIFGEGAQEKLKSAHVAVIGVGGLGSTVSIFLTVAGVGRLTIVDSDRVALSDLNRQILYTTEDIGEEKVFRAALKLRKMNPNVHITPINEKIDKDNVYAIIRNADMVIDCLDNWKSRLILNKACIEENKILIHGGIKGLSGQVMVIIPRKTPCLNCITRKIEEEEEEIPVLGTTASIIGSIQATEAIKLITGYGKPVIGKIIIYDGYYMELEHVGVTRRPDCEVCGGYEE